MPADKAKRPAQKSVLIEARMHRNHKIAALPTHTARWAFMVLLLEAKWQRPEGQFKSLAHLKACVGPDLARYVPAMKEAGLLDVNEGTISIHDWSDYQSDVSTERWRRWKDRQRLRVIDGAQT